MFELPELFGSPYVLPAIIVVVLLLLLLLLSVSRRRRARSAGKAIAPTRKATVPRGPTATAAATARGDTGAGRVSHGLAKSAGSAVRPAEAVRSSGADPVAAVIADLLQGWGDLTAEDTNRLKIFRADKVAAAVAVAELPQNLKNSEHARARLSQLRHYASSLQEPSAAAPQTPPSADQSETAEEERAAEASRGIAKSDVLGTPSGAAVSWYGVPLEQKSPAETAETDQTAAVSMTAADTSSQPAETAGGEAGSGRVEIFADVFADEESEGAEPAPEVEAEEIEAFVEEEPELVEEMPAEVVEERISTVDEEPAEEEVVKTVGLQDSMDVDDFFSSLRTTVTSAEELLALPAGEQAGMLAFLNPAELGKVFQGTKDADLKKSVIDTLEHIGNTKSLDVIHDCLEDPDPEIQVYALDAADRLLGDDQ